MLEATKSANSDRSQRASVRTVDMHPSLVCRRCRDGRTPDSVGNGVRRDTASPRACSAGSGDNVVVRELVAAAAQPCVVDGDVDGNVGSHVDSILQADARLVVFPELSLTGYQLDSAPIDVDGQHLLDLVSVCAETGSVALVGAPVETAGGRFIAMVRVDGGGATVVYCKTFLGGDEERYFRPGSGPRAIEVDRWRVGIGICRDTGIEDHVRGTAGLGVDVYVCGVVHHETELAEQQRRGRNIAVVCHAPVVMASFAGPTGGGYAKTAGRSAIWSADAVVLAEADDGPGGIAHTTLRRSSSGAFAGDGLGGA